MRDKYPIYRRGEVEALYSSLSSKDKKILDDFCLSCGTSANPMKVKDIRRSVLQFSDVVKKPLSSIVLNDLRQFLALLNLSTKEEWSKHDIRSHVKRFLKWHYQDWSHRFNELKEIRNESIGINEKKINDKTLLTKKEIETIMNKEPDLTLKTFFIALYESGMRPSELRKMKWTDVTLNADGDLSEINVFMNKNRKSKTVFVKEATFYLKKMRDIAKSDFIFPSQMNKELPIADVTATRYINEVGRHIGRKIYPYLLRHTRATELYDLVDEGKLSDRVASRFLGHKISMRDVYSELKKKNLKDAVTKTVYKFEELPPEKKDEYERRIAALEKQVQEIKEIKEALGKYIKLKTS